MPPASRMKRRGIQILTKAMKCVSIAVLGPALLGFPTANFQIVLKAVVCVTAFLALTKAARKSRYAWASGFGAIALLFNPVVPVALPHGTLLWVNGLCLITFLVSLTALDRQARPPSLSDQSDAGKLVSVDVSG
jgi:hypothetical protein